MELESTQPLFPDNEHERLKALSNYNIISNEIEAEFDEIVKLAANICETPIGLITFVDADKQIISAIGDGGNVMLLRKGKKDAIKQILTAQNKKLPKLIILNTFL